MSNAKIDWEAVERAYRAGMLSVRSIGEAYDVSHVAISKRAKKEGWLRDLTAKVRAAAQIKVTNSVTTKEKMVTDASIVDEASDIAAGIVLAHRTGLGLWLGIASKLCTALQEMEVTEANHTDYARSLNSGVDAQLKLIKGERQAYNLDSDDEDRGFGKMTDDELDRRITQLSGK